MPYICVVLLGQRTLRTGQSTNIRCVVGTANFMDLVVLYIYVGLSGRCALRTRKCHTYVLFCWVSEPYGLGNPQIYDVLSGQRTLRTEQCHTHTFCCRVSKLYGALSAISIRCAAGTANCTNREMPYICVVLSGQRILRTGKCNTYAWCCRVSALYGLGNAIRIRGGVGSANLRTGQCHTYALCCQVSELYGPGNAIHIRCVVGSANLTNWEMPCICAVLSGQRIFMTGQCHTYAWCCRVSEVCGLDNAIRMRGVVVSANFTDRAVPYICVVLWGQRTSRTGQ
jgi:hypothetical protein